MTLQAIKTPMLGSLRDFCNNGGFKKDGIVASESCTSKKRKDSLKVKFTDEETQFSFSAYITIILRKIQSLQYFLMIVLWRRSISQVSNRRFYLLFFHLKFLLTIDLSHKYEILYYFSSVVYDVVRV